MALKANEKEEIGANKIWQEKKRACAAFVKKRERKGPSRVKKDKEKEKEEKVCFSFMLFLFFACETGNDYFSFYVMDDFYL